MNLRRRLQSLLVALATAAATPLAAQSQPADEADAPERPSFTDRYGAILENNIFLRERRRPQAPPRADDRPAPPPAPVEARIVVLGIVEEAESFRAHVENRATGEVTIVRPGDAIARGSVAAIDLDGVVYTMEEQTTRAPIAHNLLGQPAAAQATDRPSATAATEADSASPRRGEPAGATPGEAAAEGEMSIAERMRQRRMQEIRR